MKRNTRLIIRMVLGIVGKKVFLFRRFDCKENGYRNAALNQEVKCRFNANVVNW